MPSRIPGFRGEFLWELDVPEIQLLALAEAIPAEMYGWRPAAGARSFSAVLVHVANCNLLLLKLAELGGPSLAQVAALVRDSLSMEQTVTEKAAVLALLKRSFEAVRQSFTAATDADLEKTGEFFGEPATVRRVYLRMLAHTHEHMGQAIAYTRSMGLAAPWPDPLKELESV